ncbi:MAG: hypothetical protein WDO74_29210 [Pseudomonadota bacterium]
MIARKPWSLFRAVLVASSVLVIFFIAPIVLGALAGFLKARSGAKTVEIVRYVTVAHSSGRKPPSSASSAP